MNGTPVDFLAVDEIQLCAHRERGYVFTDRLLHARDIRGERRHDDPAGRSGEDIVERLADGLLAAAEAGATAIIQPGGSIRDDDVIKAADEAGLAMVFTGMRHFRH